MAPVLAWTVCAYRKPGMSEEDYHHYMSEIHGPLVKGLMAKYGMLSFSMVCLPLKPSRHTPHPYLELLIPFPVPQHE